MTTLKIEIPDIGDAADVEVIEVCVNKGDSVAKGDALIVVESDKASMEVPSPSAGRVKEVLVALESVVNTGDHIVLLESESASAETGESEGKDPGAEAQQKPPEPATTTIEKTVTHTEEEPPTPPTPPTPPQPPSPPVEHKGKVETDSTLVYAGPAVRKLARELGVQLVEVVGTGAKGRILKDDVKIFVKQRLTTVAGATGGAGIAPIELPDFSRFGELETVPLSRMRKKGARNLHKSWVNLPHVTQLDEVDVTDLEDFRSELNAKVTERTDRLSPLPFILKACANTLQQFPNFNSSIHPNFEHLVVKKYFHLGMAVDTPEGLVVPVIRDVDKKGIREIAAEARRLAKAAVDKKLVPEDLAGATFTISSLGAIGGTGFTPIINAPEVAILGVSRLTRKPIWMHGMFAPRQMLPLSLSYDHRAVNGAEAGRFMQALASQLANTRMLAL